MTPNPFDWELDMAKSRGGLEYYELLNKREEAATQPPVSAAPERATVPIPPVSANTREGVSNAAKRTSRKAIGSKEPAISEEEALGLAEDALRTWGRWIREGAERVTGYRPQEFRSQFAPPNASAPPPDEADLAAYVERTPGFEEVSDILWARYVKVPAWHPEGEAKDRRDAFRLTLAHRFQTAPWVPPRRIEIECEADILADIEAESKARKGGSLRGR